MAFCDILGSLAFNPDSLVAAGDITPFFFRLLPGEPTDEEIKEIRSVPGHSVREVQQDEGESLWFEQIRRLPASALAFEIIFRTKVKSNQQSVGGAADTGGLAAFGGGTGAIASGVAASILLGSISIENTTFTWQVPDSFTAWDLAIKITEDMFDSSSYKNEKGVEDVLIIDLKDKHPLTIFGVFDEQVIIDDDSCGLAPEDIDGIANSPKLGLAPPGQQYDLSSIEALDCVDILVERNRFINVAHDNRRLAYRADVETDRYKERRDGPRYAVRYGDNATLSLDVTSTKIKIDGQGLSVGDVVYISGEFATKRRFRQAWNHKANVLEGGNRTGIQNLSEIIVEGDISAANYQLSSWRVPKISSIESITNLDDISTPNLEITPLTISKAFPATSTDDSENTEWDVVSGWRLSEIIDKKELEYYGADSRGIFKSKIGKDDVHILINREDIRDQAWFDEYLRKNSLLTDTSSSLLHTSISDVQGMMFDISEASNTLFTDQEKLPYYRPFALALQKISRYSEDLENTGVGVPLLDLELYQIRDRGDLSKFDLSNAIFKSVDQQSHFVGAYATATCDSGRNFGSFRTRIARSTLIYGAINPSDVETDWKISTPFFFDFFGRRSRFYMERVSNRDRSSRIFVIPLITRETCLSTDFRPYNDSSILAFNGNNSGAILTHEFENGILQEQMAKLTRFDFEKDNFRGEFNHEDFETLGYSLSVGSQPDYGDGRVVSKDLLEVCAGRESRNDVYKEIEYIVGDGIIADSERVEVDVDKNLRWRNIYITYTLDRERLKQKARISDSDDLEASSNKIKGLDKYLSIHFEDSNAVINNLYFSITSQDLVGNPDKEKVLFVDGFLNSGNPMVIRGGLIGDGINISKVRAIGIPASKSEDFEIRGDYPSVFIDGNNKIMIFYSNRDTDNICVAVSENGGHDWFEIKDIIRLITGETADLPQVIADKKANTAYLFYRLNNNYLMVKNIHSDLFVCDDANKEYEPISEFDEDTDDNAGLEDYSDSGKQLRKLPSFFVVAEDEDEFVDRQLEISRERFLSLGGNIVTEDGVDVFVEKSFRFTSQSQPEDSKDFSNAKYSVIRDNSGYFLLFIVYDNGLLWIKRTGNVFNWPSGYIAEDAIIHKNLMSETVEEDDLVISNPHAYNDEKGGYIYFIYTHDGMLFARLLLSESFRDDLVTDNDGGAELGIDGEGESRFLNKMIRDEIEVDNESFSRPIFLVGSLSSKIRDAFEDGDDDLAVILNLPRGLSIDSLDERFDFDTDTRVTAYTASSGLVRIFYQNIDGQVCGLTFNEGQAFLPLLDVHRRNRDD